MLPFRRVAVLVAVLCALWSAPARATFVTMQTGVCCTDVLGTNCYSPSTDAVCAADATCTGGTGCGGGSCGSYTVCAGVGTYDALANASGTSYPPEGSPSGGSGGTTSGAYRRLLSGTYLTQNGFQAFPTGDVVPVGATMNSASLKCTLLGKTDGGDGLSLVAAYYAYSNWPITGADYTNTAASDAHSGTAIGSLPAAGNVFTLSLQNLASIATGAGNNTGFRLHLSCVGGNCSTPPTGGNKVEWYTRESTSIPGCSIELDYTALTPTPTPTGPTPTPTVTPTPTDTPTSGPSPTPTHTPTMTPTGGVCRSTNIKSVDDYGCIGDCVADDRNCWNNAVQDVAGKGWTLTAGSKCYRINSPLTTVTQGDFSILGTGQSKIAMNFSASTGTTKSFLSITGAASTATGTAADVNTNYLFDTTQTVPVDSTTGFAAGNFVRLKYTNGTACTAADVCFQQIAKLQQVFGSSLIFYDPIAIPLKDSDGATTVTKVNLVRNIHIAGLWIDGALNTTTDPTYGIRWDYVGDSSVENLKASNLNGSGFSVYDGYNLRFSNFDFRSVGDPTNQLHGILWQDCSHCSADQIHETTATYQAQMWIYGAYNQQTNASVIGGVSRGWKLWGHARGNFDNIVSSGNEKTGVNLTTGTFRNQLNNIQTNYNKESGVWMNGASGSGLFNSYNTLTNVTAQDNGRGDPSHYDIYVDLNDVANKFSNLTADRILNRSASPMCCRLDAACSLPGPASCQ